MNRISDYERFQNLQDEARTAFRGSGRASGFINALQNYFIHSIPFSVKVFLRKDMGSFTYTWGTIFFAAIWSRIIIDGYLAPHEFAPPDTIFFNSFERGGQYYNLFYPLWLIVMIILQFIYAIINFVPFEIYNDAVSIPEKRVMLFSFMFSLSILFLGWFHKGEIAKKHELKKRFDPLHEGRSRLYIVYLWGMKLIDPANKIKRLGESRENIQGLEITFLLVLTWLCYHYGTSIPILMNFAWFFGIGAVSIVFENIIITKRKRREIEARMATEFRAEKIEAAYQLYKKQQINQIATVSYAYPSKLESSRNFKKNNLKGATVFSPNNHFIKNKVR